MNRGKDKQDILELWEEAVKPFAEPTQEDWGEILRIADQKEWNALGEDASLNALSEFQTAAASCIVGRLALDYPNSTHGDGSAVDVFRLPSGTIVITRFDTFESESPNAEVFQSDSIDEISKKAKDLLFADVYGENIQNLDEFPDYDPDSDVTYEGEKNLREQWVKQGGS